MYLLLATYLFHPDGATERAVDHCGKGTQVSCLVASQYVRHEGWLNPEYKLRYQLIFAMFEHSDALLEEWCLDSGKRQAIVACTARGLAEPNPEWLGKGCEQGDVLACGPWAFYGFADADAETRQRMQERTLDACTRGDDWSCAAYADHTRIAPETGDLNTALAWSQLACTLTWQEAPCAAAGRLLASVGETEASEVFHAHACKSGRGLASSCAPGRGNDQPLAPELVALGEADLAPRRAKRAPPSE